MRVAVPFSGSVPGRLTGPDIPHSSQRRSSNEHGAAVADVVGPWQKARNLHRVALFPQLSDLTGLRGQQVDDQGDRPATAALPRFGGPRVRSATGRP